MSELFGRPTMRIDGVAKVTGRARFASDEPVQNPAYACLVTSAIARGQITAFRLEAARAVPGLIDIFTFQNIGGETRTDLGPDGHASTTSLETSRVWYAGQIVAIVVAETYEAGRQAAQLVEVDYAAEPPSATFNAPGAQTEPHKPERGPDPHLGDAAAAFQHAAVRIEARYATPPQHHNPIELFTTTCEWDGPKLTIYEPSQYMWGTKDSVARQLKMDPANVQVISRFVGGAFGSKGPNPRTAWIALAARHVGRAVKLVPTRDQGFTIATYRAETRHIVRLGATPDGQLVALSHEGWELTSRPSGYNVAGVESTARMYACPNIATAVHVVHADRATPGFMRAPPETPYMFALESAVDELAWALHMDPVELRRRNEAATDPIAGRPWSSRSLMQCFDQAAARFGWQGSGRVPGAMRDGEWLLGHGCATACYPSNIAPAAARVSLTPEGKCTVGLAAHEIGTGAYTVVALAAARSLGIAVADVTVHLGDSDLPPVMIAGGSNNAASTANVVARACEELRWRIADAAVRDAHSPFFGAEASALQLVDGRLTGSSHAEPLRQAVLRAGYRLESYAENVPAGLPASAMAELSNGRQAMLRGGSRTDVTAYAFGAHFVALRVHERTREIRVDRVVSAFAGGTIINPLTAHSQLMGGTIWGLSAALLEATDIDPATARYVNNNLADYLVPVNADVQSIEIILVPEEDSRVNPLGIKGLGEIGIVGMNAAVANAVYHATGKRIRDLPIRPEKLL